MHVMQERAAGLKRSEDPEEDDEVGDLCVWNKDNVKSTGGNRLTQNCEFFLVFYYSEFGKMSASHFNFEAADNRPKSISHNRVIKKVICPSGSNVQCIRSRP
jgi:hypothetical protein